MRLSWVGSILRWRKLRLFQDNFFVIVKHVDPHDEKAFHNARKAWVLVGGGAATPVPVCRGSFWVVAAAGIGR